MNVMRKSMPVEFGDEEGKRDAIIFCFLRLVFPLSHFLFTFNAGGVPLSLRN